METLTIKRIYTEPGTKELCIKRVKQQGFPIDNNDDISARCCQLKRRAIHDMKSNNERESARLPRGLIRSFLFNPLFTPLY